jgi:hypothetical protein
LEHIKQESGVLGETTTPLRLLLTILAHYFEAQETIGRYSDVSPQEYLMKKVNEVAGSNSVRISADDDHVDGVRLCL